MLFLKRVLLKKESRCCFEGGAAEEVIADAVSEEGVAEEEKADAVSEEECC